MTTTDNRAPALAPGGLPLLGHALRMKRDPRGFLLALQSGDPVTAIRLGPQTVYVINDPALIRGALRDPETFGKGGPITERFRAMFGNGLGISDGDLHRRQRALMQPAFSHARIVGYAALMSEELERRLGAWQADEHLPVHQEMGDLALDNLTHAMFSADTDVDGTEFREATATVLNGLYRRVMDPTGLLARLPIPSNLRYRQAEAHLREVIDGVIATYRADGKDHGDLLSMLLLARDESGGEAMTDDQLHDEVMTIFIAGAESIANTLAWACHEVATHPAVEQALFTETDTVLAGRTAKHADLPRLEYTKRVIAETLRYRTQGWALSRTATRETVIGGWRIPANAAVMYSPHALNHNPAIHTAPDQFDPDRWIPDRARDLPRGSYIPFGTGNHTCIGEPFALTEMTLTLASIASKWRLEPVPGKEPRAKVALTMPVDALWMIPRHRQH
ncbi:cytochrome P450 [Actinokineospora sp. NBRC 105648]|uniref:cytochrome P450 n=1 Tax=Actinokineospora sp. NBRC 105648 TaxID=3032206 RepID=UPI0024A0620E|nr:cytochrome P450 [Actinokineospora sp. NBRC 105648]GLZ42760.1 cytochrome P450 [Actinokineospora sp. NBRC 105648]